jgi:pimeloyl-ACP methyl ester carboxylesterase
LAATVTTERVIVDGVGVGVRRTAGAGAPVVFAHGNPTHSAEWIPFLERLERPGIAFDMPGWGFSDRPPPGEFDYSFQGQARFFGRCLDALGVDEHALLVHDWGGLALADAVTHPERVERLVISNAVPLLPGFRWHWIARWFWRVPVVGELFNLTATKPAVRTLTRQATARPGPMPEEFIDMVWSAWRPGLGRPVLKLYRSADPDALAAAGFGLERLTCPALVLWGADDPYSNPAYGRAYADRLPNAELVEVPGAGHWPWIDRPELIDTICAFLGSRSAR